MGRKRRKRRIALVTSVLIALSLVNGVMASKVCEPETEYIVKYKESAAWLMEDNSVPFDVVSEEEMKRLRHSGLLEWYEPDDTAVLLDSSYHESEQWNLDVINADGVFAKDYLGQGVRVGVLDSGINPHENFGARLLPGHNYMEDTADESNTADGLGHGTGVAGLIAGANERGYIGTAPGAMLVPLKVTDGNEIRISTVCRAIYGGIDDYGCSVLNLSLGIAGEYESLREAIDYAEEQGVTVVAASGNDGTSTMYYPAGYDSVIGVGAVNQDGTAYYRSVHNSSVYITVPGVHVRSIGNDGGYTYCTGSSFAVPQVAGAAAVLLGIDPTLTPKQIMDFMATTATNKGVEGYDEYYGHGILNLSGCVAALTGKPVTKPAGLKTGYADCLRSDACVMTPYSDLDPDSWYHDGIHYCIESGMMNGVGNNKFDPYRTTSRGMIVTIIYRLENEPEVTGENPFTDVVNGQWYTNAVIWAAKNKIVEGYDGKFNPNGDITREQLATILYRYAKFKGVDVSENTNILSYGDALEVSNWANAAMRWTVGTGIINGKGGNLVPKGDASRAEAATMLQRFCTLIA